MQRFHEKLKTLETNPERFPSAREDKKVDIELRELHFGKRPSVFRVIYTIDNNVVRVLRIRRAQRRWLSRREIDEASS